MIRPRTRKIRPAAIALAVGACCALPANAVGAPPVNDNYLQSIKVVDATGRVPAGIVHDARDTSEAMVQQDLFAPDSTGGGVEPTVTKPACGGVSYGKTLWYDFAPRTDGAVELRATGLENVLVLYEFDPGTSLLGAQVACTRPANGTDLVQAVKRGRSYTVQIGGVDRGAGPAGGPVAFDFEFFADVDGDRVLDDLDKCPMYAGSQRFGGCPSTVNARATLSLLRDGSGRLALSPLVVRGPAGTHVSIRCHRGCAGHWATRIGESRKRTVKALTEVRVAAGDEIDVYLTQGNLFGRFLRFTVRPSGLRTSYRCLLPVKNPAPRRRCTGAGS